MGNLRMKQRELANPVGNRRPAPAIGVLAAIVFLAGTDYILAEGKPVMTRTAAADQAGTAKRDSSMPPARDRSIAVEEEYQLARRQGTAQALELFIARHGDSPLAEKARAELRRLSR